MSWGETFTPGDTPALWSNGDYVEKTKLDQMLANDRWLRENADFVPLVQTSLRFGNIAAQSQNTTTISPTIEIDGTSSVFAPTGWSQGSSTISRTAKDESISGTTLGLHTFLVDFDSFGTAEFFWVKTLAIDFVSTWMRCQYVNEGLVRTGSFEDERLYSLRADITIIGHRTAQSW